MRTDLDAEYAGMTARGLDAWARAPGAGERNPPDPLRRRLGVTSGRLFTPTGALVQLGAALSALAAADDDVDVVPTSGLHFTFLALAWDHYASAADVPNTSQLRTLFAARTQELPFSLGHMRLVAISGALLLAGIPDPASATARADLAADLMAADWAPHIAERYRGYPFPPKIWHTTLARSRRQFATPGMRALFAEYRDRTFDDLALGPPWLVAANYNWTMLEPLDTLR
ncbi:MAG TPA: hypothetical protein PLG23_03980 [Thermoflexales bacterium]|nr:hypothetical protein [Anaerolineae bacterium]HQX09995.1 hypothetical protein [Thermoflexales bacterium]HQY26742.1 hypothetical protein [Thermoflexales bacterium]HQZ52594.1 hypothetical protein [Thermoflexales bacterium]HRA52423.1 hypothetical protein [Thermoflexales bacterium]